MFSFFTFCLDRGPDNAGAIRRVAACLGKNERVAFACLWCLYHQTHLIAHALLRQLEDHPWTKSWPCTYFSGVTSFATVLRAPGMLDKIVPILRRRFPNDPEAVRICSRRPGRCLKGRWLAIDEVEEVVLAMMPYLGVLFEELFPDEELLDPPARGRGGKGKGRGRRGRAGGRGRRNPADDEDAEYQAKQRSQRKNAKCLSLNPKFCKMLRVSLTAKKPLAHFMRWSDKEVKEQNQRIAQARETESTYLGPTPTSNLACGFEETIRGEI